MTKQNNNTAESKKKKPIKPQPQNSGVSFMLGDRARIKLGKS